MILALENYVRNTRKIRMLSSPSIKSIHLPGEYENVLKSNFKKIGILAEENRKILAEILDFNIEINSDTKKEDLDEIITLFFDLINDEKIENLDIPISYEISSFLWKNIKKISDIDLVVLIADMHVSSCYRMMRYTYRTYPFSNASAEYCKKGKAVCDFLLSFLSPKKWNIIKNKKTKKTILKRASFKSSFYINMNFDQNEEILDILRHAIKLEEEEIYRDALNPEEWIAYKVAVREEMGALLDSDNIRGFTHVQCCEIKDRIDDLMNLWKEHQEICMETTSYSLDLLYYYRVCYFTGDIQGSVYKSKLLDIYRSRRTKKFEKADVILNLLLPVDYVKHMKKRRMMEGDAAILEQFYRNAINYVFQCPNLGSIIYILDYLMQLLYYFHEVPGGTTFEEIGLECLAALHPPTYVHSKMVADITRCLCKHMLRLYPEKFAELVGTDDIETIKGYRNDIMDFAYHSALCHDFGKIAIMDTIFIYGRNIFDSEFEQIKIHPQIGNRLLSQNPSTSKYGNIALWHHGWFDRMMGYPKRKKEYDLREDIIIDLVVCADCMDAATDNAGRSYSKGITLEQYIQEIKDQSNTRYAPCLAKLLEQEEVHKDLEFLLTEVRQLQYRETFVMLKRLQRLGDGYTGIFGGSGDK